MADQNRPWTWEVPESSEAIKESTKRQDAFDRVSGQAVYTRDVRLPGMLYAKILTSPYAHARIETMDISEAEKIVGVRDILKFDDPDISGDRGVGAVMGIGKSATEEKVYCPATGVGLNFDHINYHLGTMNDYPIVDCHIAETHLGYGTYGAFGIGENIGAAMAAITSSAIYNATGKWILDYPVTPNKVLRALGKA
jgi:CO/xanthine dehydrogenase Mo-binding subunit